MDAIAVEDLRKTYRGGVEALRGVSFTVQAGEVFGLLGPNGAGKSTTVKILTTLSTPSAGRAQVAGCDVVREPREVRRRIGCVGQSSGVDVNASGRENLLLQGRLHGMAGPELGSRAAQLLELFELAAAGDRMVRTYSGGMKRRLDVAMGLVHRPAVLFLDEPTTGLDPESRANLWGEVRRLAGEGLTILMTTHYLEEADQLAQRLAIIDRGQIVAAGTPDALKGALEGDRLRLDLGDAERAAAAEPLLRATEGVASVLRDGAVLFARVAHGGRAIPIVVGALERAGFTTEQVAASRPSLDDVYLHATGHTFSEGDAAEKPRPRP
ncbi:MAG: ATP-binding cassette domain-containing protein [Acidobacteriota bacterium]